MSQEKSGAVCTLSGATVGLLLALAILPADFIAGNQGIWQQPKYDLCVYLTTWNYFVRDHWRLPLLDVPAMGYPEGGNVIFSDALPLGQLVSKVIHSATGQAINPFGWWVLLTYLLQGAMAVRVVRAAGVRSIPGSVVAAWLATAFVPFMTRIFHVALASHFLILWAIALYFEDTRDRRLSILEHMVLSGVALLVSAYLFVMVSALQAVTVVTLWNARRLTVREWSGLAGIVVGIGALAMIMGYGRILSATTTMRAAGYGALSWNPATLVLPPRGYWDSTDDLVRIVTTDQVEGESYVGFGVLLIVATCLVSRFGQVKDAVRRHWLFVAALLMFTAYALSNRISVGGYRILEVPLPQPIYELASFFRASGRFIWVPIYALTLLSFAALIKWVPRRVVVPVILIACLLQFWEVRTTILDNRPVIALPSPDLLDVAAFDGWLNGHRRMFQFPSWSCEPARTTEASFREMQIQLLAARMGVPSNSVYTSRQLKDCAAEAAWADTAELRGGVLYVLNKSQVDRSGALAALAGSAACIDAGWGLVCSRRSLAPR